MSNKNGVYTPTYLYPLTRSNMDALYKNDLVIKNFSPPLQPYKLIMIVCWNKTLRETLDRDIFNNARIAGIDIANIGLTQERLAYIEKGNFIEVKFPVCNVHVALEETFKKLEQEGNLKL
jgi:hypothetical protein